MRRILPPALLGVLTLAAVALPTVSAHAQATHRVASDFNGDGYADVAVGIPGESALGAPFEGAVSVFYGSADGVSSAGNQLWRPSSPGLDWGNPYIAYSGFGSSTAVGNFDGDRFADLAIGTVDSEQVNVLYGSSEGLTTRRDQRWVPDMPGLVQSDPPYDFLFGFRMETGDFNGDGFDELALGAPDDADQVGEGNVRILFGSATGLTVTGNQLWSQATPGVKGLPGGHGTSGFGGRLAVGDFGGGPQDDLAIGEPSDRGGAVHVLYGSDQGLTAAGDQVWSGDTPGMPADLAGGGGFGLGLAAGDFGGTRRGLDDLAIGVPGSHGSSGAVVILYATPGGLSMSQVQEWTQDTFGVQDEAEPGDYYGLTLAAGDLNGDGQADLAVGVPGQGSATRASIGAIGVLYSSYLCGDVLFLCALGDELWSLDSPGIPGRADPRTAFGHSLSIHEALDHDDLVIGSPGMSVNGSVAAGAMSVIYGSAQLGLTPAGSQLWTLDSPGVLGRAQPNEVFGSTIG
jgi:hypothetical protein